MLLNDCASLMKAVQQCRRNVGFRMVLLISCLMLTTSVDAFKDLRSITLRGGTDIGSLSALQDLSLAYKLQNQHLSFVFTESTAPETIEQMMQGNLDFGVAIQGWSAAQAEVNPNLNLVPMLLTGFVPTYKLSALGPSSPAVIFSRESLVRIFTGQITRWNDECIQRDNPLIQLPAINITVVLEEGTSAKNFIIKNALYQFNSTLMETSPMKLDNHLDFPLHRYAAHELVNVAANTLVTTVINTDGAFGMAFHTTAVALRVSMGKMINKAGSIVSISSESLNFAAIELATKQALTHTSAQVLTDAAGPSTWPFALFSFLMIDTHESHASCKARELLVQFFLYLYTSDQAKSIIAGRGYVPVPNLLLDRSGAVRMLESEVQCRGSSALPTQVTSIRTLGVPNMISFVASLLNSVYYDETAQWEIQTGTDNTAVSRLVNSEIDAAIINPDNVDSDAWNLLISSGEFLSIPLAGLAISWAFSPHIDRTINLAKAQQPLVLEEGVFAELFGGCLTNWNHPSILKHNLWISALINNASFPMSMIVGCGSLENADNAPLGLFMVKEAVQFALDPRNSASAATACIAQFGDDPSAGNSLISLWESCESVPEIGLIFTSDESVVPALVSGTVGGNGIAIADNDETRIFPEIRVTRNGVTRNTKPDVDHILACAYDTFNSKTLTFDFKSSRNASCYPTTEQIHLVVRRQYYSNPAIRNASSCARGLDALQFLQWMLIDDQIETLTRSVNMARLSSVPGVSAAYTAALNGILCDDEPLFITLPTIWSLNSALFGFANAAAGLGIVFTLSLLGFVFFFRNHSVMRASSPLFVITSLFGVMLLFTAVIAVVQPVSAGSCDMLSWSTSVGVTLTFAPMAAKTYRVWRIFGRRKLAVVKITNHKLFVGVSVAVSVLLVLQGIWQSWSPLQPYTSFTVEGAQSVVHHYTLCSTREAGRVWFGVICAYHGAMILISAVLALSVRRVSGPFNESSQIALTIYNMAFTLVIIGSILGLVELNGDSEIALLLFVMLWVAFFTAALLVIPKVLIIRSNPGIQQHSMLAESTMSSDGFTFVSIDNFDSVSMVLSYIVALRRQLERADTKLTELRKTAGNDYSKMSIQVAPANFSPSLRGRDGTITRRIAAHPITSNPSYNAPSGGFKATSVNNVMSLSRRDIPVSVPET